jgi:hypothetical protein
MPPIKIELPASTPRDLRDEFVGTLRRLGPVNDTSTRSYNLQTVMLVLAGISATADPSTSSGQALLATANLLMQWRDKARRRGLSLDKVTIVADDKRINLQRTDMQTLIRVLEGLREAS